MDRITSTASKMMEICQEKYPGLNLLQLGMITCLLGVVSNTLGHEGSRGTMFSYIHPEFMKDKGVIKCLDFLYREVLALKDSKIAIDRWKRGNNVTTRLMEECSYKRKK